MTYLQDMYLSPSRVAQNYLLHLDSFVHNLSYWHIVLKRSIAKYFSLTKLSLTKFYMSVKYFTFYEFVKQFYKQKLCIEVVNSLLNHSINFVNYVFIPMKSTFV